MPTYPAFDKSFYMEGACDVMAIALHRLTGFPIGALFTGTVDDPWHHDSSLDHVVVVVGTDYYLDVLGLHRNMDLPRNSRRVYGPTPLGYARYGVSEPCPVDEAAVSDLFYTSGLSAVEREEAIALAMSRVEADPALQQAIEAALPAAYPYDTERPVPSEDSLRRRGRAEIAMGSCGRGPVTLYHITLKRYLPAIRIHGLSHNEGTTDNFGMEDWTRGKLFLAGGEESASMWGVYVRDQTGEEPALLRVDVPHNELIQDWHGSDEHPCSFYIRRGIPPASIEVATPQKTVSRMLTGTTRNSGGTLNVGKLQWSPL